MNHGGHGGHGGLGGHGGHGVLGFGHHGHQGQHALHGHASSTAAYNAGLKGIKFSDLFKGIRLSTNFCVAVFFLAFALWLFILYFIRHHEPFANSVIGTPRAGLPMSQQEDRRLVNGVANALPIKAQFYSGQNSSNRNQGDPVLSTKDSQYARFVGRECASNPYIENIGAGVNVSRAGTSSAPVINRLFSARIPSQNRGLEATEIRNRLCSAKMPVVILPSERSALTVNHRIVSSKPQASNWYQPGPFISTQAQPQPYPGQPAQFGAAPAYAPFGVPTNNEMPGQNYLDPLRRTYKIRSGSSIASAYLLGSSTYASAQSISAQPMSTPMMSNAAGVLDAIDRGQFYVPTQDGQKRRAVVSR